MMLRFIRPTIPEPPEWLPHLAESYRLRVFSNFGPAATRLEQALAEKFGGGRKAVLTANATAGLTAALLAWNVKGRVIVPAFTFPATAQAVLQAGCEPLFCDVSPMTWELDGQALEQLLRRERVGAVIHVRSFGFCHDLQPLHELVSSFKIPFIVDAAAGLGGRLDDGRYCGCQGDAEVFSLHATKVFGIGEGGVIMAPADRETALRCVLNFGIQLQDVARAGMNGKLSEVHAAIGLAVLERIDAFIKRRGEIAAQYFEAFRNLVAVQIPARAGAPSWQTFPLRVRLELIDPQALVTRALADGVELRRYYAPVLTDTTLFADAPSGEVGRARALSKSMICLPIYSDMTDEEADQASATVRSGLAAQSSSRLRAA